MIPRPRPEDCCEHLSLAGLVEAMTTEYESTGRIDAVGWARRYVEWQSVVHELIPLLEELGDLGRTPGLAPVIRRPPESC